MASVKEYRVAREHRAPEISIPLFLLRSGHPDFIFLCIVFLDGEELKIRVKTTNFELLLIKKCPQRRFLRVAQKHHTAQKHSAKHVI